MQTEPHQLTTWTNNYNPDSSFSTKETNLTIKRLMYKLKYGVKSRDQLYITLFNFMFFRETSPQKWGKIHSLCILILFHTCCDSPLVRLGIHWCHLCIIPRMQQTSSFIVHVINLNLLDLFNCDSIMQSHSLLQLLFLFVYSWFIH